MRLIDADALKESMGAPKDEIEEKINKVICNFIDNAPTVSDRYGEGYAQGYIDGSTGADWKGGAE